MAAVTPKLEALISTLLNEVRTLSDTVTIQGRKTDAILAKLSIPASAYNAADNCSSARWHGMKADESLSNSSVSSEEAVPRDRGHAIHWNHNPLALRDSLDDPQSDEDFMEVDCELPENHRYNPPSSPCKQFVSVSMKCAVTDSLQSLPLHLLADRSETASQGPTCERNAFVHDHRCKSAPTSPLPRASPSRSPTSFGMKFASPTPIDYDCPSRGSELDCHAHFDASVPSAGHGMHKSVPPCASEVPALTMGRIRPPPLALHFLKAAKCPASACVAGSSFPLQLRMKLDQPKHDDSNHDNGPLLGSTNLGGSARQDLRVGEDDSRCAMEQTGGGIWMSDQKCPTDMETIGMEHNPCGALTFRDMLGNDLQHDAQLPGNALSPEAYEEAGAVTFRDMLGLQDKQKLNSGTAPTIEDSSAHSTNTLQADTSSRISAHGTLGPAGTGRSPAATESMLAPQLTFRDMLQMSPSCMGDSRGAPASAMSTASLVPSAGISDVTFGSSPYSPGLTWSEADYDNASLSDLADLPDNGTADGANAVLDAAVLGAVRAPGFQLQGMEHMQAAHNSTAGATVASLRSAVQLRNPYLQDAAVALHMGGSNSTSATSSHCNSAASTPKRKFTEMKNQDDPIQGTEHALLSIQPCNTTLVHHPSASATMLEAQSAPCVRSATAVTAGHAVQGTRPKAAPARFISPELRKSCALIDLAVLCPPSCPCEPALSTVDERADMKQPLSSGSVVLHSSGSSMDTSPETESVVTGDENDAPQSGLTIPDHVEQGVYGSVESVPCTEDAEPESSYESPRSLLPTPGCKPPPPLSAEHLAALREGSDRVARTVQKDSLECDIDLHSPHQPMLWPGDSAHGCVDESPCMRMSPSLAPVGAPCGEDATARSREAGKSEDDRGSGGSLCGVKNVADSTSLPLSGDACLSSGGTCSSTDTGCTDCSSSSGEAFSGHENKCPNAEASKDMPDVIPDTPTSSEGDERESEAMEPIAAEALCAGQDGDGTLREVLGNSDADGGGLACGGQRGETSTSLTSDELNAWKQHHCSAPLVQATDGDSLVVLTNTLLRTAFREQRRADRPRGTPRWKFLGEPLDACILDTLAGPLAAAATAAPTSSDTTQSVEEFVAQTLPPMLRLSHSFAAWRYAISKEGDDEDAAAGELEHPGISGEGSATQPSATQPSISASQCSGSLCTEDAVSCCIRRAVVSSRLFVTGQSALQLTDVRASTISCGRSR